MQVYKGLKASPGLVTGPIYRIDHGGTGLGRVVEIPVREQALFEAAIILAKDELQQLEELSRGEEKDILMFQRIMLDDPGLNQEVKDYIAAGAGSAAAMERAATIFSRRIGSVGDEYISQRSTDVLDACRRVVDILDGRPRTPIRPSVPSILVGECIYPSDIISLGRGMILGIATAEGSVQSHSAIIARTMGIPALVHLGADFLNEGPIQQGVLDADNGYLVADPDEETLAEAQNRMVSAEMLKKRLEVLADKPCITKDGTEIGLWANCSTPEDIELAVKNGAVGVGLLRSEFMIVDGRIPSEEQQYYFYVSCLQAAEHRTVTVRTFDIGADKSVQGITETSANPVLGLRGIRQCFVLPQMLLDQLCALLRAGAKGNLRVMFPMICSQRDWDMAVKAVEQAKQMLRERNVPFNENLEFGSMVEVPSAALLAEEILQHGCKFFSIGTNDLTQYTYAADRLDGRFTQAFTGPSDAVHKLIDLVVAAGEKYKVPVCICGIAAEDPGRAVRYARQGVKNLSMTPVSLLQVKARLLEEDLKSEK